MWHLLRRHPLLLTAVAIALVASFAGTWALVRGRDAARRAAGMEAAAAGEDERAVELLAQHLRRSPDDFEAAYRHAVARARVALPRGRHLELALEELKSATGLAPDHVGIRRALAEAYFASGQYREAEIAAQSLRSTEPANLDHLELEFSAVSARGSCRRAIELLDELIAAQPRRLDREVLRLLLMRQARDSAEAIRSYAAGAVGTDDRGIRRLVLLNASRLLTGETQAARAELASMTPYRDATAAEVRAMLTVLEQAALPEHIVQALAEWRGITEDAALGRLYACRLWESGRLIEFQQQAQRVASSSARVDWELQLLRAVAASALGQPPVAPAADPRSAAHLPSQRWSRLIQHVAKGSSDPSGLASLCNAVLEIAPGNPYVQHLLAGAYLQLGEYGLSIEASARATGRAPLWYAPWLLQAEARLAAGDLDAASQAASYASALAPRSLAAATTLARIRFLRVDLGQDEDVDGALAMIERLHQAAPESTALLLPRTVLAARRSPGTATDRPTTPAPAGSSADELAQCMKLTEAGDPSHRQRWIELAARHGGDVEIQRVALRAPVLRSDPAAQSAILDRLRKLLPPESVDWRLARARWLLAWGKSDRDWAEAALLLREAMRLSPQQVDSRLLMAQCLARLKDPAGAVDQLMAASRIDPAASPLAMLLLVDLHRRGLAGEAPAVVSNWCMLAEFLPDRSARAAFTRAGIGGVIPSLELLAVDAEQRRDRALAVATYREIVRRDPIHHAALNNLAELLRTDPTTRREALDLADRAVKAQPGVAAYRETLAAAVKSCADAE